VEEPSKELKSIARIPLPSVHSGARGQVVKLPSVDSSNDSAPTAAGSDRKKLRCLWYALYFPQLAELDAAQQKKYLLELAALAQTVSSTISFHPLALIFEIRSSLRYFGGIDVIHSKLEKLISEQLNAWRLPGSFSYSVSPTISGSLLLARSGHNVLVYQKDKLRSALGRLPTEVLQLSKEESRRLDNMGVRCLRDIWRLPASGLRKRFGSDLINRLNKAIGKAPEPTRNYQPPPAFVTSYDLPYEIENLTRLLPLIDEFMAQLCDFLRRHDLSTSHLVVSLLHEKRSSTRINLGLRQPSRSQKHLMLLLETHFTNLAIPAPVTAIKIVVQKFDSFFSQSGELLSEGKPHPIHYSDNKLNQFMEQLQARLGEHHIKSINNIAVHCPEHASTQLDYTEQNTRAATQQAAQNPRPLWLLATPQKLAVRHGRLYRHQPITLLSGPERIETYWWSGTDVQRNYYVATESNGSRLWVYRERTEAQAWYLHGLFA
tara:strand:+ start:3030 stop:4496 length:1467 start_codon:yes stop_codon:yes gene_type:complete